MFVINLIFSIKFEFSVGNEARKVGLGGGVGMDLDLYLPWRKWG